MVWSLILCRDGLQVEAEEMARPYSDDLRRKLLEAHNKSKGTLAELAEQFGVSVAWAWKMSSARLRTGSTERSLYRPGPKPRVYREAIRRLLERKPDLSCASCRRS
jgi:transposase